VTTRLLAATSRTHFSALPLFVCLFSDCWPLT
jgi:hypothetical protein